MWSSLWAAFGVSWVTGALVAVALWLLAVGAHEARNYWRRVGVAQVDGRLFLGSAGDLLLGARHLCDVMDDVYRQLEGRAYGGFYMTDKPCLMLRDPDLVWKMKQDCDHYSRRTVKVKGFRVDRISRQLFGSDDRQWGAVMEHLSRGFSPDSTRRLAPWLERCGAGVQRHLERRIRGVGWRDEDLLDVSARFAADAVGCCAFGIECGALDDPRSAFLQLANQALYPSRRKDLGEFLSVWQPEIAWFFSWGRFTHDTYDFFKRVALEILKHRQENHLCRDDVMNQLLKARLNGLTSDQNTPTEFSDDALVAYVFASFGFGQGLISRALTFCLFELSLDAGVQTRARQQVDAVLRAHGGRLSYEAVHQMDYLDMLLSETLRLYPVAGGVYVEECTRAHRLGGVAVEAGVRVVAPLFSLQRDAAHFPEPLRFRPERFSPQESAGRHPGLYLPYGGGQRRCVAEDFSKTTVKSGIASVLAQFELSRCPDTPERPARLHPLSRLLTPRDPLKVRVSPRAWLPCD